MQMSKKVLLTSVLALSVAGGVTGQLMAATNAASANASSGSAAADSNSTQSSPEAADISGISEHGMTAISDIQLARMAINDGYTDKAGELLNQARTLLDQVEEENPPVTVRTEVKVGDQPAKKKSVTGKPNMIPILSEIGIIEAVVPEEAGSAAASDDPGSSSDADSSTAHSSKVQKSAAIAKAKTQLQQGDAQAAVETLEPVELALVARVVSMPLKETSQHLDEARNQLADSKFHEANLSLKAIEDGLVVATKSVIESVAAMAPNSSKTGKDGASRKDS